MSYNENPSYVNSTIPVTIAKGGTNATTMSTSTGIVKFDGTSLVTSTTAKIDSSNRQTNTSQPCFLAYLSASSANATGDGTVFTVPFDTVVYDIGSGFTVGASAHYTFPVTGKYRISIQAAAFTGTGVTSTSTIAVGTSTTVPGTNFDASLAFLIDATAADTLSITVTGAGGTKSSSVVGSASPYLTFISGELVC
jgi:hypothetical protein